MRSKLGITFDNILISLTIFVINYLWIRRISKNYFTCLIVSAAMSMLLFLILQKYFFKKYIKQKMSISDKKLFDETLKTLMIFTENENMTYFETLLNAKKVSKNIYKTDKCYFYINFSQKLSSFDYFYVNNFYIENEKNLPVLFLSNGKTNEFNELVSDSVFNFSIIDYSDLFSLIKRKKFFPKSNTKQINSQQITKLKKFKENIKKSIIKAKFKEFFFSGLSLVALSIIVPFSLYYLISGTIFLIISVLCLIVKKTDITPSQTSFKIDEYI